MNESPILFSAPMVRAILEGRKTMTRRVAIPRFADRAPCEHYGPDESMTRMQRHCEHGSEGQPCRYQPGDKLWVRETWRPMSFGFNQIHGPVVRVQFAADMAIPVVPATEAQYDATHPDRSGLWRPSIHMPRWASRITLEVTAVRVERLQEITVQDIEREGAITQATEINEALPIWVQLWDGINAERGFGWAVNPFVWVVSFKLQEVRNDR